MPQFIGKKPGPKKKKTKKTNKIVPTRNFTSEYGTKMKVVGRGGKRATIRLPSGTQTIFRYRRLQRHNEFKFVIVKELPGKPGANPTHERPFATLTKADLVVLGQFKEILVNKFGWPEERFYGKE